MDNMTGIQRSALTIAVLTSFLGPFLISGVNIALPAIEKEFDLNAVALSWIVTSYLLSSAVFLLPIGKLADIRGQKAVFQGGIILFTIATALCGIAPNGLMLILLRVFQGLGAAMTMTTGAPILVSVFPPAERGKVLGLNVAAVYLGLSMGPFIGGILTQYFGWRSIFLFCIPIGIAAIVLVFFKLKTNLITRIPGKIDHVGSLYYSAGLIAIVYSTSNLNKSFGWPLLITGILFLMLFVRRCRKSAYPIFEIKLFTRNKIFAFSNIAALINYSATSSLVFLMSLFLQKINGFTPQHAGLILVAQPLMMTILSPFAGKLSDKIEPRKLATAGMMISAAGLFMLAFISQQTPVYVIVGILVIMGTGFGIFSSPNMNTIMSSVEKKQLGIASGTSATMRVVGQMMSMMIATLIFSLYFSGVHISEVDNTLFTSSIRLSFTISGLICLAGVYFSNSRGNLRN
ncbi:MAG TPA: MFS transporter [Prolixibacteraceae bacterium]|jgi:EmrB/QacA subfamily drug resistance transporter